MRFCGIWVNRVVIAFHYILSSTNWYISYFTMLPLHAVNNTWLTHLTACGSQLTAFGTKMRRGKPWIGICIFQENICSENWYFLLKTYSFQIQLDKMISKCKAIYILLINERLDYCCGVGGGGPVNWMLAVMNLSKPGTNLSKPGIKLSKPGKKHNNHVIIDDIILPVLTHS